MHELYVISRKASTMMLFSALNKDYFIYFSYIEGELHHSGLSKSSVMVHPR